MQWKLLSSNYAYSDETGKVLSWVKPTPWGTFTASIDGASLEYIDLPSAQAAVAAKYPATEAPKS